MNKTKTYKVWRDAVEATAAGNVAGAPKSIFIEKPPKKKKKKDDI